MIDYNLLATRQNYPLELKIWMTERRIRQWKEAQGRVYVSFSGGLDSTVLLHMARRLYPNIKAAFCDTGLEYPEIKRFVKECGGDVDVIKPKMNFRQVLEKFGYPVISKEQSKYIRQARSDKTNEDRRKMLLSGTSRFSISKKWLHMVPAPIKISDRCCDVMKKQPFLAYNKAHKCAPMTAEMAIDSRLRLRTYLRYGCNVAGKKSTPQAFWTVQDVLQYARYYNLNFCSVYGDIAENIDEQLITTGVEHTGCIFCMYGVQEEGFPNRFQRLERSHPQLHKYCIETLGLGEILDYMGVPYRMPLTIEDFLCEIV